MKTKFSKLMAVILVVMMVVSSISVLAVSASSNVSFSNSQLSVVTDKASTLAPGVTQNAYTVYDKNGDQVKMFVTTADMSTDTVNVYASYKDMNPTDYGMSKLTEQVAAFDEKAAAGDEYYQGTVVAGINASYYNMSTGKPTGTFVMNGIDVTTEAEGNAYGYFAVMKDGSVKIGNKGDYSSDKGNIQEAIGIFQMLIVDGEICSGLDATKKYPRQTIGITADGDVILMTADGNQAPKTIGLTIQEQAEVMLDLGCVWAGHLDGGGSCTYASKAEGSDDFVITNSPSDGSERSVANGFIIVSTAVADGTFDSAMLTAESEYVTPGSTVNVTAKGVDAAGGPADIPENAAWQLADASMGTVENGVFTSNGTVGTAVVQLTVDGVVVGETTINVVIPDSIAFSQSNITVPYTKTVALEVVAKYGLNSVTLKDSDLSFALSSADMGTMSGNMITATDNQSVTGGTVTVTLTHNTELSATANIIFGRASEIVYDFETGDDSISHITYGYKGTVYPESYGFYDVLDVVTAEEGKVKNGDYSLRISSDCDSITMMGWCQTRFNGWGIDLTDAISLSFWMYIPEGSYGCEWDLGNAIPINLGHELAYGTGWQYITVNVADIGTNVTSLDRFTLYHSDTDCDALGYQALNNPNYYTEVVYYIDDITVNYSSAVDDYDAPVISNVLLYRDSNLDSGITMTGQTITDNVVSISAKVSDDTGSSNASGINADSAQIYIDGNAVDTKCDEVGLVTMDSIELANGTHTFRVEVSDKMGNASYVEKTIVINAEESSDNTIKYAPADATLTDLPVSSLYWMNLTATAIENVDTVEVKVDLDNNSTWELDNIDLAEGFEAEYIIDAEDNDATITITRTGDVIATGETVLASLPIRVWTPEFVKIVEDAYDYRLMGVQTYIEKGKLTETDGNEVVFSSEKYSTVSEYNNTRQNSSASKDTWHIHTAAAIDDLAPTCTAKGYTGRTFCDACNSVVEWGTTIPATGHTYEVADDVLKCACGDLFSGVFTDGKTYIGGIALAGWSNDSYFVDGVALTGVQVVDGYYYDFGEDGICAGQAKFTGLFYDNTANAYRYSKLGVLTGGWQQIDDNWHYFKAVTKVAATGEYTIDGVTFNFDETGMTKGAWHTTDAGTRYYYGPTYYYAREAGYMTLVEIDGKTYNFDVDGYTTPGTWALRDSTSFEKQVYVIGDDGAVIERITAQGTVACSDGGLYYINEEGVVPMNACLVKCGDDYYYVVPSGKVVVSADRVINEEQSNGLLPAGTYKFGADGKMVTPFTGIGEDGYYYEDSVVKGNLGLIELDGNYYFVCYSGKIKKDSNQTITEATANGLVEPGIYYFDADGKMVIPETPDEPLTGIGEDGYYYVDGVITGNLGLIEIDGDYYFVCYSGKIKKSSNQTVTETTANGLVTPGTYYFDADGKMDVPEAPFTGIGDDGYYYVDGVIKGNAGLIEIDGNYYFVCYSGKIKKGSNQTVTEATANGLVEPGIYYFDAEGKMDVPEAPFTGIGEDGYYYVDGAVKGNAGLIEIDGDYYFVCYSGKIKKGSNQTVTEATANGLVTPGVYYFGADGKMVK